MKDIIENRPYLLWLLGVLIFSQFVAVPVMEWQDEKKSQLELVKKRLGKAQYLIATENETKQGLKQLRVIEKQYHQLFVSSQTDIAFKLKNQALIEEIADKNNLTVNSIGWKDFSDTDENNLKLVELQLRFTGKTKDVIPFHFALEELPEFIKVEGFDMTVRNHLELTMGQVDGIYRLLFAMELAAPSSVEIEGSGS